MSEDDGEDETAVRVWFVARDYTDKGLISVTYATPDGERTFEKQQSTNAPDPTAGREVDPADLDAVEDAETRERYREEARRVREEHDPDDAL